MMKKFLNLLLLFSLTNMSYAFTEKDLNTVIYETDLSVNNNGVIDALQHGDANKLSKYFNDVITMKLPQGDEMSSVSKNQASINIKMFFDENNISGFSLTSERELGQTKYIAGKLRGNREYSITIMMKADSDRQNILTVRIN